MIKKVITNPTKTAVLTNIGRQELYVPTAQNRLPGAKTPAKIVAVISRLGRGASQ